MSSIPHLEREAERRRALFAASLLDLRNRLTLPGLADLAVGYLDPRSTHLRPVYSAVRRNPLVAASVVAGAAWLLRQSLQDKRRPQFRTRAHRQTWSNPSSFFPPIGIKKGA